MVRLVCRRDGVGEGVLSSLTVMVNLNVDTSWGFP